MFFILAVLLVGTLFSFFAIYCLALSFLHMAVVIVSFIKFYDKSWKYKWYYEEGNAFLNFINISKTFKLLKQKLQK